MSVAHEQASLPKSSLAKLPKISAEVVLVNKTIANHILGAASFPLQRPLSEVNIERLVNEYKRGWYVHGTPLFFAVLPNGDNFLLNGHHSLTGLARADKVMQFTFIYHPVKNLQEAGHLYSRFDIHKRRNWLDAFRAAGFEEKVSFDKNWLNRTGSAVRSIMARFSGHWRGPDLMQSVELQLIVLEQYLPYAEKYHEAMAYKSGRKSLPWLRGAVMGVGLELFRFQPKRAYDFFYGSSADDGLTKHDPRKLLNEYLFLATNYKVADRSEAARAVANAWNGFFKNEEMNYITRPMEGLRLLGTKWDGKDGYDPFEEMLNKVADNEVMTTPDVGPGTAPKLDKLTTGTLVHKSGEVTPVTQYVGNAR